MYGLLAVCGSLVLLGARGQHEPEVATLTGKTSKGFRVTLVVVDGEVRQLATTASIYCKDRRWYTDDSVAAHRVPS